MDSLNFDYTSYSDASTPRTPSPRTSISSDDMHHYPTPPNYKAPIDLHFHRNLFDHPDEGAVVVTDHHHHHHHPSMEPAQMWSAGYPSSFPTPPGSRGSLLEELYDHDIPEHSVHQDVYIDHRHQQSAEPGFHGGNWSGIPQTANGHHHVAHQMRHPHDIAMTRRATFPYVRHDRAEHMPYNTPPFMGSDHDSVSSYGSRPSTMYSEPLSLDGSPHISMCEPIHPSMDEPFAHTVPMSSPHPPYHDFHHLDGIKTEDGPVIVPSQTPWSRPSSAGMPQLPCISPHAGMMVQHTDDAASKETQYLRRRCFNCHTTEPPSWRRSTLNPGKIVCNKCGLYERTHLRPRPLRFDELRAGSKTRKQPKVNGGSPKAAKIPPQMIKKEPSEMDNVMPRRASVSSSSASSVHSASSDWDESVSVYSGGSNPPSSFNSPAASTFPIPRDLNSQSPPLIPPEGGIRLPNAPLSDIASLQSNGPSPPMPRKAASMPVPYYPSSSPLQQARHDQQTDYFVRRGSVPLEPQQRTPEVTGWQPVADIAPIKAATASPQPPKTILAA
ncbi:transcription factor [Ganoderma sinense ZZ0214-1]|uniref:Transcription factor n=1 Tax=Ganoderma sinense ZZ0214-1 TaxID=1077348 RepID=A0A2G8SUF4_9APHY|nr:transcription factor [Ganoderma sinense ZZ0214-1]